MPDLLWESDSDGSTNWYNNRWLEYTGQSFEEAIGWGWTHAIHPDDREVSAKDYAEAVEAGRPLRQEHRIRSHQGEYRWFVVNATPHIDDNGRVIRMYGAATDIHDRKHTENALREREERLQKMLNIEGVGVITFGDDGTIKLANDTFLAWHGYSRQEVEAGELSWQKLTPPEYRAVSEEQLEKMAQTGRVWLFGDGSKRI